MKKLIALFAIAGCLTFGMSNVVMAQEQNAPANDAEQVDAEEEDKAAAAEAATTEEEVVEVSKPFNQVLKDKFIEGGPGWMTPILIVLILGLALVIERTIYLNLATTNTKKLLEDLEAAISTGDVEKAKDVCRNTRGPVASVFYQGLLRYNNNIDDIEKAVVSYGGVQTARLETNMSWLAFCIAVAPSLGFLGTVVGMVKAFDDIEQAGDIDRKSVV